MDIGIVTAMLRWEPGLLEQMAWAQQHGFECIELSCWHTAPDTFDGLWAHRWDGNDDYLRQVATATQTFNRVNLHASFFHAYDPTYCTFHPLWRESAIDEVLYALKVAARIGGRVVTCHPNGLIHGKTECERRNSFQAALVRLNDLAAERDVLIGVEAIQFLLPLEYCKMVAELGLSHVGLTLDLGHAHLRDTHAPLSMHRFEGAAFAAFGSVANFIAEMAPWIKHVHLHDSDGAKSHLPLGEGHANLCEAVVALKATGYDGFISVEAEGTPEQQISYRDMVRNWLAEAAPNGQTGA